MPLWISVWRHTVEVCVCVFQCQHIKPMSPLDIAAKIFTGGDASLDEPMWRAMICAGFYSGAVYVSSDSSVLDPIMSIGVWFGPGNVLYATWGVIFILNLLNIIAFKAKNNVLWVSPNFFARLLQNINNGWWMMYVYLSAQAFKVGNNPVPFSVWAQNSSIQEKSVRTNCQMSYL